MAAWVQVRLQVAAVLEADALKRLDAAEHLRRELNACYAHAREERDMLHDIRDSLAEKEDELMRREAGMKLLLEHPPHPYPFIDPDS